MRAVALLLTVVIGLVLGVVAKDDDILVAGRRELLQFCHPQRARNLGTRAIGAFFSHPEIGGVKLDYCLSSGDGCGKRAADAFCEQKGLKFAESYVVWNRAGQACGRTKSISTGQLCTGDCRGFRVISCAGSLFPGILNSALNPSPPTLVDLGTAVSTEVTHPVEQPHGIEEDMTTIGEEQEQEGDTGAEEDGLSPQSAPVDPSEPVDAAVDAESLEDEEPPETTWPEEPAEPMDTVEVSEPAADAPQVEQGSRKNNTVEIDPPSAPRDRDSTAGLPSLKLKPSPPNPSIPEGSMPSVAGDVPISTEEKDTDAAPGVSAPGGVPVGGDTVEIHHPGLGDVVLPGQQEPIPTEAPPITTAETRSPSPPGTGVPQQGGRPNVQSSLFCQERGQQSATAAARGGCGAVTSACASATALAGAQQSNQGRTGRRLMQEDISTEECKTLFANECQAAAFDNANGLCAILMGNGPTPGEERPGCETAEQAREIFKTSVQEACDKFMAGAFP